jgi:hypothetical protein
VHVAEADVPSAYGASQSDDGVGRFTDARCNRDVRGLKEADAVHSVSVSR